jgi:hypothetical protein
VEAADWGEEEGEGGCSEWAVIFIVFVFFYVAGPRRDIFFHLNSPPEGYLLSKKSSQNPFLVAVADFVNFAK